MLRLEARALAVDLGPGVGVVELQVLDAAAGRDDDAALAALLQPHEDLVLDLEIPGEVVLAGLQHRARRRYRIAAALHLDAVEMRPVRLVVGRIDHPVTRSPGLNSLNRYGPVPTGLRLAGASRDLAPL